MPRVLFVVPHLNNSMRLLADYLRFLDRSYEVTLLVLDDERRFQSEFPNDAAVIVCPRVNRYKKVPSRLSQILRQARKHDLVVSWAELTQTYLSVAACAIAGKPCIGFVHTNLTTVFGLGLRPGRLHRPCINLFYPRLRATVGVSEGVARDLRDNFHLQNAIPIVNGIDIERIRALGQQPIPPSLQGLYDQPVVINVAALTAQKNHEVLLESHARLLQRGIRHKLLILGEGPLRQTMTDVASSLGVASSVVFGGYVDNPYPMMRAATAFALTSRFEGHPLVVAEALALGLPMVSTDCPSGPSEILDKGRYGRLVPVGDVDRFTEALGGVLTDRSARDEMIRLAPEGAERNRIQLRAREMEELFRKTLAGETATPLPQPYPEPQ